MVLRDIIIVAVVILLFLALAPAFTAAGRHIKEYFKKEVAELEDGEGKEQERPFRRGSTKR